MAHTNTNTLSRSLCPAVAPLPPLPDEQQTSDVAESSASTRAAASVHRLQLKVSCVFGFDTGHCLNALRAQHIFTARVHVCVCARARARARVCVCVCSAIQANRKGAVLSGEADKRNGSSGGVS
jgi:hypothetical protein